MEGKNLTVTYEPPAMIAGGFNMHERKYPPLARNGTAVAQMTLIPKSSEKKRIGIAEGKFKVPDEFDKWDKEIEEMFGG